MTELDRVKQNIIELVQTETDLDLLDLVYKLLLMEGGNESFNNGLILCG